MPAAKRDLRPDPEVDYLTSLVQRLDTLTDAEVSVLRDRLALRLNPHSLQLLEGLLAERRATGWRADPHTMALHLDHGEVEDWPFHRFLAGKFRDLLHGDGPRVQVWSMPAQVGKTSNLKRGCRWALDRDPSLPIIWLSYADLLAREAAMWVRDSAIEHEDELRFSLKPDLRTQKRWVTTKGGGMLATGLGGSVSGFPAGLVIIDDPLKNWQEAHSETARDEAWNEIVAVARLRLREGGAMLLAHTRWHRDDPTGRMRRLQEDLGVEVEHVALPMLAGPNDPLGRPEGEPLEPRRFSLAECKSRAAFLGSYLTAALEQQDPQPEEGGEVKRVWWRLESTLPEAADAYITSWDMKLKDKETGDYVVGQAWARVGAHYWLLDQVRGKFTLLQTKVAIALLAFRHPQITAHVIENSGNGPEVMEQLRTGSPEFVLTDEIAGAVGVADHEREAVEGIVRRGLDGLLAQQVNENKLVRLRSVLPLIEGGNVHLPERKGFTASLIDECAAFPKGNHDDQVDALSQALRRLRVVGAEVEVASTARAVTPPLQGRAIASVASLIPNRR